MREGQRKEEREGWAMGEGEEGMRWVFLGLGAQELPDDWETRGSLTGPSELTSPGRT